MGVVFSFLQKYEKIAILSNRIFPELLEILIKIRKYKSSKNNKN